jgi:hypothetical protein
MQLRSTRVAAVLLACAIAAPVSAVPRHGDPWFVTAFAKIVRGIGRVLHPVPTDEIQLPKP